MIDYSDFFEEVIQTHVEIEQWFAGVALEGTLQRLLARFSPEFSMIAPSTGTRMNAAGVNYLFTAWAASGQVEDHLERTERH